MPIGFLGPLSGYCQGYVELLLPAVLEVCSARGQVLVDAVHVDVGGCWRLVLERFLFFLFFSSSSFVLEVGAGLEVQVEEVGSWCGTRRIVLLTVRFCPCSSKSYDHAAKA